MQRLKHVTEDVCEVRYNSLMTAITDMKTDVRLLTESFDRHKMNSIKCTTSLGVCMTNTKKSIDGLQTDINTLVDNCTKTKQEPKQQKVDKETVMMFLKVIIVLSVIIMVILKGDPKPLLALVGV